MSAHSTDEKLAQRWYDRKSALMEASLGKEHDIVMHAIIPFAIGGGLDLCYYPDSVPGAEVIANANASGGLALAKDYWVSFPDGYRAHQIRLEGGDCSTDSFCYPSV